MMHIVIDAHLAVKQIDGVSRYLQGLLSELPQVDTDIQYSVLALPWERSCLIPELFSHSNVRRIEVDLTGPSPKQHVVIPKLLRQLHPDLYHHPQYDLPVGVSVPSIVTIHDLKYILQPQLLRGRSRLKGFYIKQSLRHSIRKADGVIAVSQNTLTDLRKFCDIDDTKAIVIGHGAEFRTTSTAASSSQPPDLPEGTILFVGTRRPHKNIQGLVQALAILRDRGLKPHLIVCGKPYAGYDEPERLTDELNLRELVRFLDFVPDEELGYLYKSAKVVALPSFYEGFGISLIEAMAHGKPVIGSQVSSMPEVIGDAGLTVDPYDPQDIAAKLETLLTDTDLYEKLVGNAQRRFPKFSWSSVAKETFNFYIKVLQNS